MNIELPLVPAGILVLLAFFSPYAIALVNHPGWAPRYKRLVAVVVAMLLALVVLALYFVMTGDVIPQWPVLILLAITVSQAAYLLLKPSASAMEARHGIR